eukprot:8530844-Heterocapsa_arctica.AAC.1
MVLLKEEGTEEQTIVKLHTDLTAAKQKLTDIGQVLNDEKEQIFAQRKSGEQIWNRTSPEYKGRVGQAMLDLGITLRTHTHSGVSTEPREWATQ